jgi:hypothetical protein
MSGGHFSYKQYEISYMADEIEHIITVNDCEDLDEWNQRKGRGYEPEVVERLKEAAKALRQAFIYAQRVDWLLSCDDSPEYFLKRLDDELRSLK